VVTSGRASDGLAIVALGPFDDAGAPIALDARCARLALRWPDDRPLCCARGALVDGRARLSIVKRLSLAWSPEGPLQHDPAPSGIVERLADEPWKQGISCCSALDRGVESGGVRGDGCRIRALARDAGEQEDVWLLAGCALFPLDLVDGALVPSSRIPEDALVPVVDGAPSLWDEARARVARRFGAHVATAIDEGVAKLHAHRAHGLHLKTLK
jgi:hypothetical protein